MIIRNNLLTNLEQLMQEHHFQCEWGIDWLATDYYLTLTLQFELPNPKELQFGDTYDRLLDQASLPYDLTVVFYDELFATVLPQNAIVAIPINHYQGLAYGECLAIVKYLKYLTSRVPLLWEEFLVSEQTTFGLTWSQEEFAQFRHNLLATQRYNETALFLNTRE